MPTKGSPARPQKNFKMQSRRVLAISALAALVSSGAAFAPSPAGLQLRSAQRAAATKPALKMSGGERVNLTREGFTSYVAVLSMPYIALLAKMKIGAGAPAEEAPKKAAPKEEAGKK